MTGGYDLVLNESDYGKIFKLFESFIDEAKNTSKWQIRAAIHVGSVEDDDSYGGKPGKIGNGIDYCSRYLDNEYLKESLNINSEEKFIFGLSDKIVEAVKHETWFDENSFEKYTFTVKAYTGCFYLYKKNLKTLSVQNVENLELKNEQKLRKSFLNFCYKVILNIKTNKKSILIFLLFLYSLN